MGTLKDQYAREHNGGDHREIFYLQKIGAKSFADESQDNCKDTESNIGPLIADF